MPSRCRVAVFFFFFLLFLSLSLSLESEEEESDSEDEEEEEVETSLSLSSLSLSSSTSSSLLLELLLPSPPALCFLAPWSNVRSHQASPQSVEGALALLAPTYTERGSEFRVEEKGQPSSSSVVRRVF